MAYPSFLTSDIQALWRSVLSARATKRQKLKMVGYTNMAKGEALTESAVKGLNWCFSHVPRQFTFSIYVLSVFIVVVRKFLNSCIIRCNVLCLVLCLSCDVLIQFCALMCPALFAAMTFLAKQFVILGAYRDCVFV